MLNTKIFFLCFFIFRFSLSYFEDYHYDYMTYDTIIAKIGEFANNYPQYIQMYNITEKDIPLPNVLPCGTKK